MLYLARHMQEAPAIVVPCVRVAGPTSLFVPRTVISHIVHQKLIGEFSEIQGRQKIPLRLPPAGWAELDVICDQMGIPRS